MKELYSFPLMSLQFTLQFHVFFYKFLLSGEKFRVAPGHLHQSIMRCFDLGLMITHTDRHKEMTKCE